MSELPDAYRRALRAFSDRVLAVRSDQWRDPTPCTEWSVVDLVAHVVIEQRWAPPLLDGAEPEPDAIDPELISTELTEAAASCWNRAAAGAQAAFGAPGALERNVELSYGTSSAEHYCREMLNDLVVHAWDLARAVGADDRIEPELVDLALAFVEPRVDGYASTGLFAPPVPVSADADPQARLLAMQGRDPNAAPPG